MVLFLQDLEDTPNESFKYHLLTSIYDVLNLEGNRPIWPVLYPSSLFSNTVTTELCSLWVDLNNVRATHSLQLSVPLRNPNNSFLLLLSGPSRLSYSTKDKSSAWVRVCHDECLETGGIPSTSEGIL